jgi:hypothetical protein
MAAWKTAEWVGGCRGLFGDDKTSSDDCNDVMIASSLHQPAQDLSQHFRQRCVQRVSEINGGEALRARDFCPWLLIFESVEASRLSMMDFNA